MEWYQNFFQLGPIPSNAMYGWYDLKLVLLSYIIASIASYVALDMSSHLRKTNTRLFTLTWWAGGAIIMGVGIWSMHFVGMLAFNMDAPMTYSLFWTGLSMIIAVIAASIAFLFFMIKKPKKIHYLLSGIILGSAILAMHYTGMAGMNDMYIHYKVGIFLLSVLIAIIAATAALWLAVYSDRGGYSRRTILKMISALIMGIAIAGMHYTGMAAAVFTPIPGVMHGESSGLSADPTILVIIITTIVVSIMSIAIILSTTKYYVSNRVRNEKDFLEIVLNGLDGGVIAFDPNKKLRLYNQVAKKWFANIESLKESIQSWQEDLPLLKTETKKPFSNNEYPLDLIFQGKKVKAMEAIVVDKNGKDRVLSIDGQLLTSEDGENLGAVIVCQDITERKEIDQMKNEFISTVSHELRTPLTSIRGSLGLITDGVMGEIPEKISSLLQIACNNSERLVRLINDILDTEKIESGKMVFHFARTDISKLIEQAVISNKSYADKYNVVYKITNLIPEVQTNIDPDRIRQVLDNLLSNAAKFSKSEGVVSIDMKRNNNSILISIADNGSGIPQEFQSRIFSKFYQADSSDVREKGGTGLGLSICKSIIEAHSGKIWFNSNEQGTTFYFELLEYQEQSSQDLLSADKDKDNANILICEDEPDASKLLELILKGRGYNSIRVATIAQAKKALANHKFCLMTLDLMLPDGNGLELLRWMRSKPEYQDLPVIVISAISIEQEKIKGAALGVIDWINKPIDEDRLYKDVAKIFGNTDKRNQHKVLHIEDDKDIAEVVSTLISNICKTDVSSTVASAKNNLSSYKYDLIILDLNLKDGTGYEILTYLEENGYRIPVIILSVDDPVANISKNIVASMVKSKVDNKDLLEKIESIIDNNKMTG